MPHSFTLDNLRLNELNRESERKKKLQDREELNVPRQERREPRTRQEMI